MSEASSERNKEDLIGSDMSVVDQNVLRTWRESLVILDPRYQDKRLLKAAARSMVDEEYRSSLLRNTEAGVHGDEPGSPEENKVRFFSNTPRTLHVILPPVAGEVESRPGPIRDFLRSRTSDDTTLNWFRDDWNISDPGTVDPPWILPNPDFVDGFS
ncbi:hypothetical protein [Kitasatospora griseola]|uniref:hypothetical protein n=1 Tax=Kitasatospora griseola TaxID=2064 RepID=UPI0016709703|nr:hypothetical protein [Kitasatospora griseola]GGR01800.1 hypothetical protein GCM10010195_66910 [Kitasatospora griseola]